MRTPPLLGVIAAGRMALGVAALVAPRRLVAPASRAGAPADETVTALRLFAARDVALGLGTLAAAARQPGALPVWGAMSALADAADSVVLAGAGWLRPVPRGVAVAVALGATAAGVLGALSARSAPGAAGPR